MHTDDEPDQLILALDNSDVDVKVNAISKLQALLESGIAVSAKDGIINALKSCLKTSNQHLSNAILAALPPLLPLLIVINPTQTTSQHLSTSQSSSTSSNTASSPVDAHTLRHAIIAFLPHGGIIDRLSDSRDKTRENARESLEILGGLAFKSSSATLITKAKDGKGLETPLTLFERLLREVGLTSKVWKIREQSLLILVHLRRAHHFFPIRPYLLLLVSALEDSDARVRECARESVVELYTGPGVTDAARADLKTAMAKKNVRKGIVESILSKLVSGSGPQALASPQSEGSEDGHARENPKDHTPPSLMIQGQKATAAGQRSKTQADAKESAQPPNRSGTNQPSDAAGTLLADVRPVYVTSIRDMEHEFASFAKAFEGKEAEQNWLDREGAILRVRGMLKDEAHLRYSDTFLACLKESFIQWSLKTLVSLRTTVAVNTCLLYTELAVALGTALDPLCETLLANLLKLAGLTKKITAQHTQSCVSTIITHCSVQPRLILPLLWHTLQEKTFQSRAYVVEHLKLYMETHGQRSKLSIESTGGLELLEKSVKRALADANPAVRESARVCFWVFEGVWKERGRIVFDSLDANARKQLDRACPNPGATSIVSPAQKPQKKSVAAAIAASRAKAKALAAAPPTLRHQATHSAQSQTFSQNLPSISTSPPRQSNAARPLSPKSRSPPTSPRSRILSSPKARSPLNSPGVTSPPHPSDDSPTPLRRSRLVSQHSGDSFRAAIQTTLPDSPTQTPVRLFAPRRRSDDVTATRRSVPREAAEAAKVRPSIALSELNGDEDLLMPSTIPLPEDSESETDEPNHHLSFSPPLDAQKLPAPSSVSQARSISPKSVPDDPHPTLQNALSSISTPVVHPPIVEDAMRARAEQAESAAERLLELVDPEEEAVHHSPIPASLLVGSSASKGTPLPIRSKVGPNPTTPTDRTTNILKQAALFADSPAQSRKSASLLSALTDRKQETGWWLKRMNLIKQEIPRRAGQPTDSAEELKGLISALEKGTVTTATLQHLAVFCVENSVPEQGSSNSSATSSISSVLSPISMNLQCLPVTQGDIWSKDKNFARMFNGLITLLEPQLDENMLEYGLIVLWEILHHQAPYVEGREGTIFSLLLRIRHCNKVNILEATTTLRDALTSKIEPVYGLTTMHASLSEFRGEAVPADSTAAVKASTYAFGLSALGKFILRLPPEVLEDELPRMRNTLTSALNDRSSLLVRESAAASIIAAQLVLQDETHLFTLLDGLADEKKNLLTYLFDKHAVRGVGASVSGTPTQSGMERLAKEMSRLDTRTSTPLKSRTA